VGGCTFNYVLVENHGEKLARKVQGTHGQEEEGGRGGGENYVFIYLCVEGRWGGVGISEDT